MSIIVNQQEIHCKYNLLHQNCPECGSDLIEQTCMGFIYTDLESAYDGNRASCHKCGWHGIVHNLVGDKQCQQL